MRNERHDRKRVDTALRQFQAVRQRKRTNMLNRTKVERITRQVGLRELAAVADDGNRYYALLERYRAEGRPDDGSTDE